MTPERGQQIIRTEVIRRGKYTLLRMQVETSSRYENCQQARILAIKNGELVWTGRLAELKPRQWYLISDKLDADARGYHGYYPTPADFVEWYLRERQPKAWQVRKEQRAAAAVQPQQLSFDTSLARV
jgi:hypothetical protein